MSLVNHRSRQLLLNGSPDAHTQEILSLCFVDLFLDRGVDLILLAQGRRARVPEAY